MGTLHSWDEVSIRCLKEVNKHEASYDAQGQTPSPSSDYALCHSGCQEAPLCCGAESEVLVEKTYPGCPDSAE
jgi:hypothetical protein